MGFYLELIPPSEGNQEFKEAGPPSVYWVLYAIGIFALSCMTLAAHQVLGGLVKEATVWDWALFGVLGFLVLFFFAVGFKMLALRKFIRIKNSQLEVGYFCWGKPIILKKVRRDEVRAILLVNQRPAPNMAPKVHEDSQYYIKGHWRLILELSNEKKLVLDKHVEKGALENLKIWTENWRATTT